MKNTNIFKYLNKLKLTIAKNPKRYLFNKLVQLIKPLNLAISTVYKKLITAFILNSLLTYFILFIVLFIIRIYVYNYVCCDDEGTLWQQMNDPEYDPAKPPRSANVRLNNGTVIRVFHDDYGMYYMQQGDQITPLGMNISSSEASKLESDLSFYDPNGYLQPPKEDLSDTSSTSSSSSFVCDMEDIEYPEEPLITVNSKQLFFEGFVNESSKAKSQSELVQNALNYIKDNLPKDILSKTSSEIGDDSSPINKYLADFRATIKFNNKKEEITYFYLETAVQTYNAGNLLNCLDNTVLIEKIFIQTFDNILKKAYGE